MCEGMYFRRVEDLREVQECRDGDCDRECGCHGRVERQERRGLIA